MNIRHALCVAIFGFATNNVFADPPSEAERLGSSEALIGACAQLNPKQAAKYKNHAQSQLPVGLTKAELDQIRQTSEYKASYKEAQAELAKPPTK